MYDCMYVFTICIYACMYIYIYIYICILLLLLFLVYIFIYFCFGFVLTLFQHVFFFCFFFYTYLEKGRGDGREYREKKFALLHVIYVSSCLKCCDLQTKTNKHVYKKKNYSRFNISLC